MRVREFELYHGAVLTKLVRSDRPITLRMIETKPQEAWAAYTLNNEASLYIKYSTTPSTRKRTETTLVWMFIFANGQLRQLQELRKQRDVYVALVCGQRDIEDGEMYTCLMKPNALDLCINVNSTEAQAITVKYEPGKQLRVSGPVNKVAHPVLIARNSLDTWTVPGS